MHYMNIQILFVDESEPANFDRAEVRYEGGFVIVQQMTEVRGKVKSAPGAIPEGVVISIDGPAVKAVKRKAFPAHLVQEVTETPMAEDM